MIVAKSFKSEINMTKWLANHENMEELKSTYPPLNFKGKLNLTKKRIEIHER